MSFGVGDLVKRDNFGWLGIVVEVDNKHTVVCWLIETFVLAKKIH